MRLNQITGEKGQAENVMSGLSFAWWFYVVGVDLCRWNIFLNCILLVANRLVGFHRPHDGDTGN